MDLNNSQQPQNNNPFISHIQQGVQGHAGSPALSTTLDRVPLGTDEQNTKLLDLVDKLRECRVDQYIDLPQVVVVGDQSSGKSSVLEAITQIPFPRASVACTRFATQIRLRRDPSLNETTTTVKILPYRPEDAKKFEAFAHTVSENSDFTKIFQQAGDLIFSGEKPDFLSRDILSIERTGPSVPHMMTVVDLPGIIHNPTKTQTIEDVRAISDLSKLYMDKDRTIILPIVSCDAEYAKQIIIRRCKESDPQGVRTLGIITKPDMTLTAEREAQFIDLARNRDERNQLQLGWHVLRNRAHNEMNFTSEQRDVAEKRYFADSNWGKYLEPSQLGVEELRGKLSTQLIRHVANELFKVQGDIERQLQQCNDKLKELGPGFENVGEMRQELQNLCKRSGSLTREATQGGGINPLGEDFFPRFNDRTKRFSRNLRSRVVITNEQFCNKMENNGTLYNIEGTKSAGSDKPNASNRPAQNTISRRDYIEREVKPLLRDNPGQELSVDINPRLVYRLFQSYSENWSKIAETHVAAVQQLCEDFLFEVLGYVWPQRMRTRVWRAFVQKTMDERFLDARKELEELKKDRFRNVRAYHSSFDKSYYSQRSANGPKDNAPVFNKYEDTLNKMLLYYDHQLPTFITNVITQVIERHLIDSMELIFEGEGIYQLRDADVKAIMEEDFATAAERRASQEKRDTLRGGLDIIKEIASRPDLGPYEYQEPSSFNSQSLGEPSFPPIRRREVGAGNQMPSADLTDGGTDVSMDSFSHEYGANGAVGRSGVTPPESADEEDEALKKAIEESRLEAQIRAAAAPPPMPARSPVPVPQSADTHDTSQGRRKIFGRY